MKNICVPISREAEERLDFNSCVEGDLIELDLETGDFDVIWNSGFFSELNSSLNLVIDDYEDEKIPFDKIDDAIAIFDHFSGNKALGFKGFYRIGELMKIAKEKKTGLFFYF